MIELEWLAQYEDGTYFPQVDENFNENKYPSINRHKIIKFSICGHTNKDGKHILSPLFTFDIKGKWWYRRVTAMDINVKTGNEESKTHFYVIGIEGKPNTIINKYGIIQNHPALINYNPPLKYYEE